MTDTKRDLPAGRPEWATAAWRNARTEDTPRQCGARVHRDASPCVREPHGWLDDHVDKDGGRW